MRENDLSCIGPITIDDSYYSPNAKITITSSEYYHQVFLSSKLTEGGDSYKVSKAEVFSNRNDTTHFIISNMTKLFEGDSGYSASKDFAIINQLITF
jgi:hypothetical protein